MITVEIKHEDNNGREFGYGIYVNGYIWDDEFDSPMPVGMYASECVPFGQNTSENIKKAERRVKRAAMRRYKQEFVG